LVVTDDAESAQSALEAGKYVVMRDFTHCARLRGIDVVAEATGDLLIGAEVALSAITVGKHVVAANSDVQATVGPLLGTLARRAGAVYTDVDGDEPGLLKQLYDACTRMGLDVVVAGNCKGVLKRHATPATQAAFAAAHGLQPWLATAAADGTKLNLELNVVANAVGFPPAIRGMHGPATALEDVVEHYKELGLLDGGHYVDYVLGGRGIFAIVKSDDPEVQNDFRYLKMGEGPFYLFHEPRVLIHYQAPLTILRAVRHGQATVSPREGRPVADTIAVAKRDLRAGQTLDGVRGFDTYGLIEPADQAAAEQRLPIGIAQYARLRNPIRKNASIGLDDVEFDTDNLALRLRREQDSLFADGGSEQPIRPQYTAEPRR
jgi:predicted homoserine dehydrogenase-like protein